MGLQYITDSKGQTTGVFIPIEEWNSIKSKYQDIEQEVPDWHKMVVHDRIEEYKKDPNQALEFDQTMDDLESYLPC